MGHRRITEISLFLMAAAALEGAHESLALPQGFKEEVVFQGLVDPTAVRFSPDGRVFVAEKSGRIKVFDSLTDSAPSLLVDLGPNVHNFWDRGLLGIALHPDFPATPLLYALYTYDFDPQDPAHPAPRYGDTCPDKDANGVIIGPGATADGCVVDGRLVRLTVGADNTLVGDETVLLENRWCQQFPTHSVGTVAFGPEGALYVSAGDGASFDFEDWGQYGGTRPGIVLPTPVNPCGDPDAPRGAPPSKPDTEGGALRSQGVRTPEGLVSLDGTVIRVDPATGAAWPGNPLIGGATSQDDAIIAYGLRNPFRMTLHPVTGEIWLGDVGWYDWEEINRIPDPNDDETENFGWPCIEGPDRLPGYNAGPPDDIALCTTLADAQATPPFFAFEHYEPVYPGDPCNTTAGSSVTGLAFYQGGTYPPAYHGALFFGDFSRSCVFAMTPAAPGGPPVPANTTSFLSHVADARQVGDPDPVDLQIGPGGDLFVVDHVDGTIRRISYDVQNGPPTARIEAAPTNGPVPLRVAFDAGASTDPDPGATLFFAWDLDGDGQYDDGALPQASREYTTAGDVVAALRVTDDDGATSTATVTISAGNTAPTAALSTPLVSETWHVGEAIAWSGGGNDPDDGPLGAESMTWKMILHHCVSGPDTCHEHSVGTYEDVSGGSFTGPDHQYYAELEFVLTVTDSGGLTDTASVRLPPEAVFNAYESDPPGATLSISGFQAVAPFQRGSILGSGNSLVAVSPQIIDGTSHYFVSWENGASSAARTFTQGAAPLAFLAKFEPCNASEDCDGFDDDCNGIVDNGFPDTDFDGQRDCIDDDDDNDTRADVSDCAPLDATAYGAPSEVQGIQVSPAVPTRIAWTPQSLGTGTQYVAATGTLGPQATFTFASGICLGTTGSGELTDTRPGPAPGSIAYYLVKSRNACGPGTFGTTARDAHPGCP